MPAFANEDEGLEAGVEQAAPEPIAMEPAAEPEAAAEAAPRENTIVQVDGETRVKCAGTGEIVGDYTQCSNYKEETADAGSRIDNIDRSRPPQVVETDGGPAVIDKDGKHVYLASMSEEEKAALGIEEEDTGYVKVKSTRTKYDDPNYCGLNARTERECAEYAASQRAAQEQRQRQSAARPAPQETLSSCEYARRYRPDLEAQMCRTIQTASGGRETASAPSGGDTVVCRMMGDDGRSVISSARMTRQQCDEIGGR